MLITRSCIEGSRKTKKVDASKIIEVRISVPLLKMTALVIDQTAVRTADITNHVCRSLYPSFLRPHRKFVAIRVGELKTAAAGK